MPKVAIYELNEVPWPVVDYYVGKRPSSHIARLLRQGRSLTTRNDDDEHLSPWRTWPTLHNSMRTRDHNSYELGQDPETFRGVPLWDAAEEAGLRVGLFGPLQSWPPRPLRDGFYVPDTFAKTPEACPATMSRFQAFNLQMTADNAFSSDAPLSPRSLLAAGMSMVRHGLRPKSAARLARHLADEAKDSRHKAARSAYQVLPSFDLFWRLHRKTDPHLSIFFTNHVASMMHRYWGDAMPDYRNTYDYEPDEVFSGFLLAAMDMADEQIGLLMRQPEGDPERVLVVAASMGQDAIPPTQDVINLLYLVDGTQLLEKLGLRGSSRLAMHPKCSVELVDEEEARRAEDLLKGLTISGVGPIFEGFDRQGRGLAFNTAYSSVSDPDELRVLGVPSGEVDGHELGLTCRPRLGGGNTAYHIPEGIFIAYGQRVEPSQSRTTVDVLDVAPTILGYLGVATPPSMQGDPDSKLFALEAMTGPR